MTDAVLKVAGLQANYGKSRILHGVSLSCRMGAITAILGRNGVGKSTTLKSIMGLVKPHHGSVLYDGKEIAGLEPFETARLGMGFVPEERHVFPTLTVMENLQMGTRRRSRRGPASWSIKDIFDIFPGLERRKDSQGQFLSGGEQQMLSIGRALVGSPQILLVDDPSEGLAPVIVEVLEDVIRDVSKRGVAVLLVESKLPVVERLAEDVYVMSKGEVVYSGKTQDLKDNVGVRKKYLEV